MLINFCSKDQIISALEIQDRTLTLYFHPDKPSLITGAFKGVLGSYLQNKNLKFKHNVGSSHPKEHNQHVKDLHATSVHIHDLPHLHWVFEKKINTYMLTSILDCLATYQNNPKYRLGNQAHAFENFSATWWEKIVAGFLRRDVFGTEADVVNLEIFMTASQMKQVIQQFELHQKKNNRNTATSTDLIVNLFADTKPEKHPLPLLEDGNLLNRGRLEASTCQATMELHNSILNTRENNALLLGGSSVLIAVFGLWLGKTLMGKTPHQTPQANPQPERRRSA